ncbi:MAG: carbamoyl-phosphate synthase large subunit [Pseudomonadota bacterium]
MPKRSDIQSILIIGAGPIVIGQACEFDYSGAQACKALKEEGFKVILVNSNPATIMTDPNMADVTYIEPIQWDIVEKIIEKERPDAILPTMGGQTALNCALDLAKHGVLEKFGVTMIGATKEAIDKAEDREKFAKAMKKLGLDMPKAGLAHSMDESLAVLDKIGFPCIIRPSFTMGGTGGGIAYNREEFIEICERGLDLSPTSELLIDESLIGWKEYEMEVVRDKNDNCIIVCSIENFDPMGVHTGDSITVAPAQTLTDKEYQIMRNASMEVLREIGVETGGSNVQFAVNPENGRMVVIEMNPRVSRSSALASKATGFPIAKVAAKLAVGYTLDELQNDITSGKTPASFEPSIDYVVTKIPRFNFEKFPNSDATLTTQMKSVGEVMAIGRTFQESMQKAIRGLEVGMTGFDEVGDTDIENYNDQLKSHLLVPGAHRLWWIGQAFRQGFTRDDVHKLTLIEPWFLVQLEELIQLEQEVKKQGVSGLTAPFLRYLKRKGFSDARLGALVDTTERAIRQRRINYGIFPVYKRVDTCAAEFSTSTAYMYSTYEEECEAEPTEKDKVIILGGGPNRIGQGIEFDYCCVHAALALREDGYETIMINCNPETVSTDYDTSDRLYFEPVTLEDVLEIVRVEKPKGVIVHYGGQTPLKLSISLEAAGVPIVGTSPDAIDRAEDRERFKKVIDKLGLKQPPNRTVRSVDEAMVMAKEIGYPLVVRPSYVLGGRAMEIVYNDDELRNYMKDAVSVSHESPVLLDRFLNDAIEVDIDAIYDGNQILLGGIMEHIEQAGVHSGDSACSIPPYTLSMAMQDQMRQQMQMLAKELEVVGLMNAQFAIQGDTIYVLEVNPRASRTVPFVSKATGLALAKIAARCMMGFDLSQQGDLQEKIPSYYSVKAPVFPFNKFPGSDPILGPEMKSTGEVMGVGMNFGQASFKAKLGSGSNAPKGGKAIISVRDADKGRVAEAARNLIEQGFKLYATDNTAKVLTAAGVACERINKVYEGRPHIVDMIKNDEASYIVNTTEGKQAIADSFMIRRSALQHNVPYTTTLNGCIATCMSIRDEDRTHVVSLQELHKR